MSVPKLKIELTAEQIERAAKLLSEHPHNQVGDILAELQVQGQAEVNRIQDEITEKGKQKVRDEDIATAKKKKEEEKEGKLEKVPK